MFVGSREMGPSAEREGQGLADHVSWKLGEANGAAGACRDGRDREVPSGQSSTREWETEAKGAPGSGSFPVGSVRTLHGRHRAGPSPESHCSFLFLPFSVSELPPSRAPQTRGLCPATVGV